MHGRVKVRTSAEEKARKDKERQEKLKVFKHAMQIITTKRNQGELDKELLDITGKVLCSNPDITTLWNIRREILLKLRSSENDEDMSQINDAELQLTEFCLKINPKSYTAWHQREWVLITRPDPDWKKELDLCNIYLKLDERNFHTWDYRRFVVSNYKPQLEEEFVYTTEKLMDNFSNYSAWHYRSKMLVALYPDLKGGRPIEDIHHKHELNMVQNAVFTDPDDTSGWFYLRWLLGAVKSSTNLVVCTVSPKKTTVAFNKQVNADFVQKKVSLLVNNDVVPGIWLSASGLQVDSLWILQHEKEIADGLEVKVEYQSDDVMKVVLPCEKYKNSVYIGKADINFLNKYSAPVVEELNIQLESCRQLLELEPDSKWTLFTTTVFLHCIDPVKHHEEAIANLKSLKTIDKLRVGYYDDLITKWSVESQLLQDYTTSDRQLTFKFDENISSLPHLQYYSYCDNVDLSNQNLTSNSLPSLVTLQHCKKLSLANNKLTTLRNFPPLDLEELNVQGNSELKKKDVDMLRERCTYNIIV